MDVSFLTKTVQINGAQFKILLQNGQGECALIALANVLLISSAHSRYTQELFNLVKNRETVTLDELVQTLADIGVQNPNGTNVDRQQLLQVLPQLYSGLNINPEFNGSFEDGVEMSFFRLYNVGIVHGWIIDGDNDPNAYEHVSKYSYMGAQKVLVQSYEIQKNNAQYENAEQIQSDAIYLRSFLARSATQLTDYGLSHLREILVERSYAVLFRNDHFCTLYKNNGELFTLVTDPTYRNRKDINWQSLKSVNGSQDSYYTGNFIPTSLERTDTTATGQNESYVSNPFSDQNARRITSNQGNSGASEVQQIEDDEELARRLQEHEDMQAASSMQNGNTNNNRNPQRERFERPEKPSKRNKFSPFNGSNDGKDRKRDKLKKNCIIM
ncbi:YGL082W [Saccharomyces arboricola H-6]|uniref:YGL082W n=1 Tax=Saccharomyces arboricola (strain H-6 / AS 2.3317 / CBS 10644) TaxID=1160507 RepID=J8Q262_SACAR|nr:YGL082W [Saccharomyces arboricola H-6]